MCGSHSGMNHCIRGLFHCQQENAGPHSSSHGGSTAPTSTWKVSKVELCRRGRQQRHEGGRQRWIWTGLSGHGASRRSLLASAASASTMKGTPICVCGLWHSQSLSRCYDASEKISVSDPRRSRCSVPNYNRAEAKCLGSVFTRARPPLCTLAPL